MENAPTESNSQIFRMKLPMMNGARESAERFTKDLPSDLTGCTVELDGKIMRVSTQGFADELCKQILEIRNASSLILLDVPEILSVYVLRSAKLRNCERVTVVKS